GPLYFVPDADPATALNQKLSQYFKISNGSVMVDGEEWFEIILWMLLNRMSSIALDNDESLFNDNGLLHEWKGLTRDDHRILSFCIWVHHLLNYQEDNRLTSEELRMFARNVVGHDANIQRVFGLTILRGAIEGKTSIQILCIKLLPDLAGRASLTDQYSWVRAAALEAFAALSQHCEWAWIQTRYHSHNPLAETRLELIQHIPKVVACLTDQDSDVRSAALKAFAALSQHSETRPELIQHVSKVVACLTDQDHWVQSTALNGFAALSQHCDPLAEIRSELIQHIPKVITCLTDQCPNVRSGALKAFAALSQHCEWDSDIRSAALKAFAALSRHSKIQSELIQHIPKVIACLTDQDERIRYTALNAFSALSQHCEWPKYDQNQYNISQRSLHVSLIRIVDPLAEIRSELIQHIPKVITCLTDQCPNVRSGALKAFAALSQHCEWVVACLTDQDSDVRSAALKAFVALSQHCEWVITYLTDQHPNVRSATLNALAALSQHCEWLIQHIPKVITYLTDQYPNVRSATLNALAALSQHCEWLKYDQSSYNISRRLSHVSLIRMGGSAETRSELIQHIPKVITCLTDQSSDILFATLKAFGALLQHCEWNSYNISQRSSHVSLIRIGGSAETQSELIQHIPKVITCLTDQDSDVRSAALNASAALSQHSEFVLETDKLRTIFGYLHHSSGALVCAAINVTGQIAAHSDLLGHAKFDVRATSVTVLCRMAQTGLSIRSLLTRLKQYPDDFKPIIETEASKIAKLLVIEVSPFSPLTRYKDIWKPIIADAVAEYGHLLSEEESSMLSVEPIIPNGDRRATRAGTVNSLDRIQVQAHRYDSRPCSFPDQDGYDQDGYDQDGYDQDGYDQDGYDQDGYVNFM
ncbi:17003_t:CDS:10, partial [Acaulospora colombiana]